ncbi:MAG: class I SAM-dependent methyltransferase [Bacteroidia bacterium]
MKDRFSDRSADYAVYRPVYPVELIDFILSVVKSRNACWDVGTGSGQLLALLAPHFQQAAGTDSSAKQISFAPQLSNVEYRVCRAEDDPQFNRKFDLITVAQAIHWFKFVPFYELVEKYLEDDGLLVITGYGLITIDPLLDELIHELYTGILGKWWDPERKYIDDGYRSLPFPFAELDCPAFTIQASWNLHHFEGFFRTWSAYTLYLRDGHPDPIPAWMNKVRLLWPENEVREVRFPVLLRAGRKKR